MNKKRMVLSLILLLVVFGAVMPLASAATFDSMERVLNDVTHFLFGENNYQGVSAQGQEPWRATIIIFLMIFVVSFAATAYVPVFRDHKSSRVVFGLMIAWVCVAMGGLVAWLVSLGEVMMWIALTMVLIFFFLTVIRSFSAGASAAGTEAAKAEKELYAARAESMKAKQETELTEKNILKQTQAINQLEELEKEEIKLESDLDTKLNTVLMYLNRIAKMGVSDSTQLKGLMQRSLNIVKTLLPTIKQESALLSKILAVERQLEDYSKAEIYSVTDEAKLTTLIQALAKKAGVASPDPDIAAGLARKIAVLNREKTGILNELRAAREAAKRHTANFNAAINSMISDMNSTNLTAAIQKCQEALNIHHAERSDMNKLEQIEERLRRLDLTEYQELRQESQILRHFES